MSTQFYPTQPTNRIEILDVLRGLAIIGVLISNIIIFSGFLFTPFADLDKMSMAELNKALSLIMWRVVSGKFYPILSILFGAGLYMQFQKRDKPGFMQFFIRRMLLLLLIGAVHQTFWPGDVVTVYALFAFLLIPMKNWKPKTYLIVASIMFVLHFVAGYIFNLIMASMSAEAENIEQIAGYQYPGIEPKDLLDTVQNDGFKGFWFIVKSQFNFVWSIPRYIRLSPSIVLLFTIGAYLFGSGYLTEKAHKLKYLIPFLIIGCIGSYLMYVVDYTFRIVDNLFLALAYISLVAIILRTKRGYKALMVLAPLGRMALTNYIMQSIICILIFYGIGLGYFGKLPLYLIYIISIVILAFQIQFSKLWLRKYQFGPLEWIWRKLTYGHLIKNNS